MKSIGILCWKYDFSLSPSQLFIRKKDGELVDGMGFSRKIQDKLSYQRFA